ncbi:MAG: hypothetical protein IMZ55_02775, partial [Acidobacteria bacterium]|nr:hypothetical protein [Acidobacteriota bacterium]
MPRSRSELLQQPIPPDLAALLWDAGADPEKAWLSAVTDLNLAGGYEAVFLLVEAECLRTVALPNDRWSQPVRIDLARAAIEEIRTRQGVGGGFIEALVDGVYVEVLAYSNARADLFH